MTTDSQLQRNVLDELAWDPSVHHEHIGVAVDKGVVTLTGFVRTYPQKIAAEKAVRRVYGVKALAEELEVRLDGAPRMDDAEIARRIIDMLAIDVVVPHQDLQVKVERGWVTITGTVDWNYQRDAAKRLAGHVAGVVGVSNLIEVRHLPAPQDVKDRIVAAFKRSADLEAAGITVVTTGSTVELSGHVPSWKDRRAAELAAWGAPGVSKVEDRIIVS